MAVEINRDHVKNQQRIFLAAVKDYKGKEKFGAFQFKAPADHWLQDLNTQGKMYVTAEKEANRVKVTVIGSVRGNAVKSVVGYIAFA